MISQSQDTALVIVAKGALLHGWKDYAEYCLAREKGLRQEAFTCLDKFMAQVGTWTFDECITFIKFLFPHFENIPDADYGPFPQPVKEFVKPFLIKWCDVETHDSTPFRWYGRYYWDKDYYRKAIEINPQDHLARKWLIEWLDGWLYERLDFLPTNCYDEPEIELPVVAEAKAHIMCISNELEREKYLKEIEQSEQLIINFRDWKASGHSNFEQWGIDNNKPTSYSNFKD
ncbi:MAG: hypothetical protein M0D57_17565 [Sphingobacteriales bacterium JAD_PAG50586_3]|nr:MAG: hypothetical protein M0D57_17565 [Sphingobacteriales bacterium JAD_PAG50586_3]